MKAWKTGAALGLALIAAACGGEAADKGAGTASAAIAPIAAPAGKSWSEVVAQTPQGGMIMGNPDAPVKLVEFASFTCSHCADFARNGFPRVVEDYVKTGRVSFELRNFVRDPADIAAALLSRCNGPEPFFPLSEQIFAAQSDWLGKLQSMPAAAQERLQAAQPAQAVAIYADQAGFAPFVQARASRPPKAQACLTDQAALQNLVDGTAAASREYQITGTPTFLINNEVVQGAADWAALEPRLKAAVGS